MCFYYVAYVVICKQIVFRNRFNAIKFVFKMYYLMHYIYIICLFLYFYYVLYEFRRRISCYMTFFSLYETISSTESTARSD